MLTEATIRDLLSVGYETSDSDYLAHYVEHTSRTVYFMAEFLVEHQYRYISSVDLQRRIDDQFRANAVGLSKGFNPVDWFSAQWTMSEKGEATPHFENQYRALLERQGEKPTSYRIRPALHKDVVRILSELRSSARFTSHAPD